MPARQDRTVGERLSASERDLLTQLCSGDDTRSATARDQLRVTRWGGYAYDDCECILLTVDRHVACPVIDHDGGPFAMVEVSSAGECHGLVELWVVDGYLHSVDYMPFGLDHAGLPTHDEYDLELVAAG